MNKQSNFPSFNPKLLFIRVKIMRNGKPVSVEALRRWARLYHHPIDGLYAHRIWDALSSHIKVDVELAREIYQYLGYEPFAGFPLKKAD